MVLTLKATNPSNNLRADLSAIGFKIGPTTWTAQITQRVFDSLIIKIKSEPSNIVQIIIANKCLNMSKLIEIRNSQIELKDFYVFT